MTSRQRILAAAAIVVVPLLVYPMVTLVGGLPHFPGDGDCGQPPEEGRPVNVVFGRYTSPLMAEEQQAEVERYGFVGTHVEPDGCGRWMLVLANVATEEVGTSVVDEARSVDLSPTLELDEDG